MNAQLAAIHHSAIRLNSLAGLPAFVGKSVDGTDEARVFSKSLESALDSGLALRDIEAQLAASLGPDARGFIKSHVKGHTRVVNGKVVQVQEHETSVQAHLDKIKKSPLRSFFSEKHPSSVSVAASEKAHAEGTPESHTAAAQAHAKASRYYTDKLNGTDKNHALHGGVAKSEEKVARDLEDAHARLAQHHTEAATPEDPGHHANKLGWKAVQSNNPADHKEAATAYKGASEWHRAKGNHKMADHYEEGYHGHMDAAAEAKVKK